MELAVKQLDQLLLLARALLAALKRVSDEAREALRERQQFPNPDNVFASGPNQMADGQADRVFQRLGDASNRVLHELQNLGTKEPYLARVEAKDESDKRYTYYVSRGTLGGRKVTGLDGEIISYRSPMGRLAECEPGDTEVINLPTGTLTYTLLGRTRLTPRPLASNQWDGVNSQIETSDFVGSLVSLIDFLQTPLPEQVIGLDLLQQILAEERAARVFYRGFRRRVIETMSLRDQPILDRYQGEVSRLPLDLRLMLSGPPGTGKTTTLIKRIAMKRSQEGITEEERSRVPAEAAADFFGPNNWVMFTPTDLLKLYLKEAFAKEGVAASDQRVRTWTEERRRLGRDVFQILRSQKGGRFVLDELVETLRDPTAAGLISLAEAFSGYFEKNMVERYEAALAAIEKTADPEVVALSQRVRQRAGVSSSSFEKLFAFPEFRDDLLAGAKTLAEAATKVFESDVNARLRADRTLLNRLAEFLSTLSTQETEDDEDEEETEEAEEQIPAQPAAVSLLKAQEVLKKTFFAVATSAFEDRQLSPRSRNFLVMEWIGASGWDRQTLKPMGARLVTLRNLRFLAATHRNLILRVPAVFNAFRRESIKADKWFRAEGLEQSPRRIGGAEVDVMIRLMLRNVRRFLNKKPPGSLSGPSPIAILESTKGEYLSQVFVDEATDFSPVQLACMMELAHPYFRSFFACGDVRQRVTSWGLNSLQQLSWVGQDIETRNVLVGYRLSPCLAELASSLAPKQAQYLA